MSTLTIEIPDELAARLVAASARASLPPSAFVQKALETALPPLSAPPAGDEPSLYESMKDGFGCVSSGVGDLSTNPKHMEGYGRGRGE